LDFLFFLAGPPVRPKAPWVPDPDRPPRPPRPVGAPGPAVGPPNPGVVLRPPERGEPLRPPIPPGAEEFMPGWAWREPDEPCPGLGAPGPPWPGRGRRDRSDDDGRSSRGRRTPMPWEEAYGLLPGLGAPGRRPWVGGMGRGMGRGIMAEGLGIAGPDGLAGPVGAAGAAGRAGLEPAGLGADVLRGFSWATG